MMIIVASFADKSFHVVRVAALILGAYIWLPVHGWLEWIGIVWAALVLNGIVVTIARLIIHKSKGYSLNMKDDNWHPL